MDKARLDLYDEVETGGVEGEMSIPMPTSDVNIGFNTLDEPIRETIMRDLKAVGNKFKHVLIPTEKKGLLREWDLWGPLLLCTFMAVILQGEPDEFSHDGGPQFAEVFVIVWIGSAIVTLNSQLLGGHIVCVLGYCLLPTTLALIGCRIILFMKRTYFLLFLRVILSAIGFLWATFAAMVFLGDSQPPRRKALAMYPISLFYFFISWLVLSHSVN